MATVILLGTEHPTQRGKNTPEEFREVLHDLVTKHNAAAIAEEIENSDNTVASALAHKLDLEYLIADPDLDERRRLGILDDIRFELIERHGNRYPEIKFWPRNPGPDTLPPVVWKEYSAVTAREHRMREQTWLKRITDFDIWPLLFICGADHFGPFSRLLRGSNITVTESYDHWISQQ